MADLIQILNNAASSLAAARGAAATASNNVQNANTPGYSRQVAVIEANLPADQVGDVYLGQGASLVQVTQARDRFLEAQLPAAFAQSAGSSAASSTLQAVSALDPQAQGGIGDALSGFYDALRQLSQNPSDPSLRQAAVGSAQTLALSFNSTASAVESARTGADAKITADVSQVNQLASTVASLNGQIRAARAGGGQPNDLLDARQSALDQLAQLTGGAPVTTDQGDASVFLAGGAPLVVGTTANALSAAADPANGGHVAVTLSVGGATSAVSPGGEIGGLLSARDGALKTAGAGLDQLAFDLAGQLNAVHQAGFGLPPANATGNALFSVGATAAGAATQIAVNPALTADPSLLATAAAANQSGSGANVLSMVATGTQPLSTGLDASGALAQVTSAFGSAAQGIAAAAEQDASLTGQLTTMRESTSGVSIDDELIAMQKAQTAYQAIAKVIQTSSDMLDTLLQLT